MATIDLDELRKEIEADEKSLAEKKAVLRFLEGRAPDAPASDVEIKSLPIKSDGIISLDSLLPDVKRRTMVDDIHDVINRFGDQEFTVVHVEAAMKQIGYEFKGEKSPRPRISTALGKLEDQGVIVKTFEGKGNVPNRYKLKVDVNDLL